MWSSDSGKTHIHCCRNKSQVTGFLRYTLSLLVQRILYHAQSSVTHHWPQKNNQHCRKSEKKQISVFSVSAYLWSWKLLWVAEAHQQTCARHWPAAWCSVGPRQRYPGCPSSQSRSWRAWPGLTSPGWSWTGGRYPERVWVHCHHRHLHLTLRQSSGAAWQPTCLTGVAALRPGECYPTGQLRSQTHNCTTTGMEKEEEAVGGRRRVLMLQHDMSDCFMTVYSTGETETIWRNTVRGHRSSNQVAAIIFIMSQLWYNHSLLIYLSIITYSSACVNVILHIKNSVNRDQTLVTAVQCT